MRLGSEPAPGVIQNCSKTEIETRTGMEIGAGSTPGPPRSIQGVFAEPLHGTGQDWERPLGGAGPPRFTSFWCSDPSPYGPGPCDPCLYNPSVFGPDPSGPSLCSPSLEDPSPCDPSPHDPSLDGPAWLTLPASRIPVASQEKMFLPLKAKLFRRGQKPSAARSYRDISLPAFLTSPMAVGAPALGIQSGEGLWWELPWVK